MRHLFLFAALIFACAGAAQQVPYFPIDNYAPTSGAQTISAPFGMVTPTSVATPVRVSQTAQINFVAGTRLAMHPGFSAGSFSGNGYFHGQIGNVPDFDVAIMEPDQNTAYVGQFEKLEMGVILPPVLEQQVDDFIANASGGINPFDPDQISVEAVFTNGVHSYTVYGFYYEEFIRDPAAMSQLATANWISQPNNYKWRIRFAPPSLGNWYCSVRLRVNNASIFSFAVNNIYFQCIPSQNKGWIKKGNDNWHLAYSGSNESYFAIGQNIGWNDGNYFNGGLYHQIDWVPGYTISVSGYLDILNWISELGDDGGNMVRISTFPSSFELEIDHLNNYSDKLNRAWELDRLFELCEQKNIKISIGITDKRFAPDDTVSGPELKWSYNPYHTQIPSVSDPQDFFTDATAKSIYLKKMRYFLSRWGYSTSLAILDPIGEIDNGFDSYNDNTTLQEVQTLWFTYVFLFVKAQLSFRPMLTSTSYNIGTHPGEFHRNQNFDLRTPFDLDECDITSLHWYKPDRQDNKIRLDQFNSLILNQNNHLFRGIHRIWNNKPTYFGEMGTYNVKNDDSDKGDMDGCSDITMHNSLWSSAFMGGFGTGLYWWSWHRSDYRHANFPALNAFFDGIDFQTLSFKDPDFWDDAPLFNFDHSNSNIETFYIVEIHANRVMGWVHNTSYWWGNMIMNCTDRYGRNRILPDDNDAPSSPQALSTQTIFEIHNLTLLTHYDIDWYHTRSSGGFYQQDNYQANILGTMKPTWPGSEPDWAYKAYRSGRNFRESQEITHDTLFCWQDTLEAKGNHESDSLGNFNYHWDFGNGQQSNERNAIVVYTKPGTYLVTLIVSDSLGWSDTLKQFLVKPQPCVAARLTLITNNENSEYTWDVFPNPASNVLSLTFSNSWESNIRAEIFSLDGKIVLIKTISSKEAEPIDIAELASGIYFLRVRDRNMSSVKRIIVNH